MPVLLWFQLTRNLHSNENMYNSKFNFLLQGLSLKAEVLISSSPLYSKYYHTKRFLGYFKYSRLPLIYCSNVQWKLSQFFLLAIQCKRLKFSLTCSWVSQFQLPLDWRGYMPFICYTRGDVFAAAYTCICLNWLFLS